MEQELKSDFLRPLFARLFSFKRGAALTRPETARFAYLARPSQVVHLTFHYRNLAARGSLAPVHLGLRRQLMVSVLLTTAERLKIIVANLQSTLARVSLPCCSSAAITVVC